MNNNRETATKKEQPKTLQDGDHYPLHLKVYQITLVLETNPQEKQLLPQELSSTFKLLEKNSLYRYNVNKTHNPTFLTKSMLLPLQMITTNHIFRPLQPSRISTVSPHAMMISPLSSKIFKKRLRTTEQEQNS